MSVTALVTQSIPHLGASFTLHVMALGWSAFQTWATQKFNGDYQYIISGPQGACPGIDFISGYFTMRATFQVGTTVVNFVSMIASAYLCWRLFDVSNVALMRGHNEFSLYFIFRSMGGPHSRRWALAARLRVPISVRLHSRFASSLSSSSTLPLLDRTLM
jgi:hypothetical protein